MRADYTPAEVLRLAKRHNNPKRAYLLVNPLQGKHLPVSPRAALAMMEALGRKLAERFPETGLVIGFAETATAIGAMAAAAFGPDCAYVHTTREAVAGESLDFDEEHSHAVLQRLATEGLSEALKGTPRLLLVDDEISTGKTLCNIVAKLRTRFPALEGRPIAAASILDRLTAADEARLGAAGMECDCLVKLPPIGDLSALHRLETRAPRSLRGGDLPPCDIRRVPLDAPLRNPRRVLPIGGYLHACRTAAEGMAAVVAAHGGPGPVLVLGTEECMLPALLLGRVLEDAGHSVLCHATTRSPIALGDGPDYPIRTGYQLESFYEGARETYLYNLAQYDTVAIVTDAAHPSVDALSQLAGAARLHGCRQLLCFEGGDHA